MECLDLHQDEQGTHPSGLYFFTSAEPDREAAIAKGLIETTISQVYSIELAALRAASRGQARVAHARQIAMYLAHVACCMPLTEVGRLFHRDRTTVRHACAVIEDRRDDTDFDHQMQQLEEIVRHLCRQAGVVAGRLL